MCWHSNPKAPVTELTSYVYEFCTNNFPANHMTKHTTVSRDFDLSTGGYVIVWVDFKTNAPDWSTSDCLYHMLKVVHDCETSGGMSTGGSNKPVGAGGEEGSEFTISTFPPTKSARTMPDAEAYHFEPIEDTYSKVSISCDGTPTEPEAVSIPSDVVMQAVEDHCSAIDGDVLQEGDERSHLVDSTTPYMFIYTKAMRSVTLTKDGCLRALTPLIWMCTDLSLDFYGGIFPDTLIEWSITLRNPPSASKSIVKDTGDTNKVARSTEGTTPELFNATESTKEHFRTSCNAGPESEGALTIDYDTAYRAIDYRCFTLQNLPLAKDDQIPLTFTTTNPRLFANTITSETVVLSINVCNFAYDTLFKACTWDSRFYGGLVEVGPLQWVLDLSPVGNAARAIESGSKAVVPTLPTLSPRQNEPFNSTNSTNTDAENVCFNVLGHSQKELFAWTAAFNLCQRTGDADWEKGQIKTWTLQEPVLGKMVDPPIKATMEATLDTGMTLDLCYESFSYRVIHACTVCQTDG